MSKAPPGKLWASVIVGVALVGLSVISVAGSIQTSSAQTSTLPPRPRLTIPPLPPIFPCPLCGPSGQRGDGTTAWVYPLHFCPNPDGSAEFAIIYGLGSDYTRSPEVTFFGSIQGIVRRLETLRPGDETAEFPTVNVQPGEQFLLTVWGTTDGTQGGPRVLFGNGTRTRSLVLICECPTPQTLVSTIPTTAPTVTTAATTVPGQVTTAPRVASSVPQVQNLPETGDAEIVIIAAVGLVVLYFGLLAWSHARRPND